MTKRNKVEIKRWMLRREITVSGMCEDLGYKTNAVISNTLAGREDNRKVLGYWLKKGCPKKYLGLPKDMKGEA